MVVILVGPGTGANGWGGEPREIYLFGGADDGGKSGKRGPDNGGGGTRAGSGL